MRPKASKTSLRKSGQAVMFDIVTIQICEELLQPFVHNLMVCPSMIELCKKNSSSLSSFVAQGWKNISGQVTFDCFSMSLIKLSRPVVRRTLRTHVIAGSDAK